MNKRIYNVLALVLLGLFFLPFVLKVRDWDLIILLICGLALPAYDLYKNGGD